MLKRSLLTLLGFFGVYFIYVATFILNLEVACGIENMPIGAGVRLALMYIAGIGAIGIGIKFWED